MDTTSPPLTPTAQYASPFESSPTNSYRGHLRRRTSSFSSNHDRSPATPRSKHRFSNASQFSDELPTRDNEAGGVGLGNLADELDELDDEEEYDEEIPDHPVHRRRESDKIPRDSGIDVSYNSKRSSPEIRNFSKPFGLSEKPPDEEQDDGDKLSPDLEDAMASIARMTSYTSTSEDPLIPRTIALLQDLGNQSALEAGMQRLSTSTNSLATHLLAQAKSLQTLNASLYLPYFGLAPGLDLSAVEEIGPLIDVPLKELPLPDPAPLRDLQKLDRETTNTVQTLGQLIDTLQMGKQVTNSASRHLRSTQTMVVDLRREREQADLARHELTTLGVGEKLAARRCATECREIVAGFEKTCNALRASLEQGI